jgi:hypothetical protein
MKSTEILPRLNFWNISFITPDLEATEGAIEMQKTLPFW